MAKKMLIDATHSEETRVVVVDGNKVEEFDFESENKRQLAGNIYLAKVTRVEPSLQAAFVDYGGNRHGFLAFSEIHPDYYQIPVADREALMAEEREFAKAQAAEEEAREAKQRSRRGRGRGRKKVVAEDAVTDDATISADAEIGAMDVVELDGDASEAADGDVANADAPEMVVEAAPEIAEAVETEEAAPEPAIEAADENADDSVEAPAEDDHDASDEDDAGERAVDATSKDDSIESVADEDVTEEIRSPRKPRVRRYKIQEVVKVRQILLVQVVKEERGNKGAALTTYLSLAGRYCVLMPNTARGGGISRKITNASDRKKLKEIANSIEVPDGAGLIIRTAGAQRTKTEVKRDYEYLQRLWEQIRDLTLKSTAPAKIYEEGDLIKRSIRDLYTKEIDEVFVEGEQGYRVAKDFMKMIMPSHAKNVKLYTDALPLFARYQVESYLSSMFNPTVQLKSGGYIVIGVTEALVAIDVNSGRATKEGSIEETALKTNLEAAEEVARQLRLRDLAGLIVIDFIDMDERKNNSAVEKRFKERLKSDRARIQVGRISGFGLMEMSRQRLRPGMIEATTQPCNHCHGTGLIRSDDNLALNILRQLEEEGVRRRSREVLVKAPVGIVNFLVNQKREHIAQIEARYGLAVRVEADPFLISPDYAIEKFKTATRVVAEVAAPVVSVDASIMSDVDEATEVEETEAETSEEQPTKKRRRRRRRRKSGGDGQAHSAEQPEGQEPSEEAPAAQSEGDAVTDGAEPAEAEVADEKPAPKKRRSRARKPKEATSEEEATVAASENAPAADESDAAEKPAPKKRASRRKPKAAAADAGDVAASEAPAAAHEDEPAPKPKAKRTRKPKAAKADAPEPAADAEAKAKPERDEVAVPPLEQAVAKARGAAAEPVAAKAPEPVMAADAPEVDPDKPKRRGWWSLGR